MRDDTVVGLRQSGSISDDPLTDILRAGARQLLAQAIEAEVEGYIVAHADLTDAAGRRRIVRHGYLPEREIATHWGRADRFHVVDPAALSAALPIDGRAVAVEGISSGDFGEALPRLWGGTLRALRRAPLPG